MNFLFEILTAIFLGVSLTNGRIVDSGIWSKGDWRYDDQKNPTRNYNITNGMVNFADYNRIISAKII